MLLLLPVIIGAAIAGAFGIAATYVGSSMSNEAAMERAKKQQEHEKDLMMKEALYAPADYFQPLPMAVQFPTGDAMTGPAGPAPDWGAIFGGGSQFGPEIGRYEPPAAPDLY
jgi:hypothetical protein